MIKFAERLRPYELSHQYLLSGAPLKRSKGAPRFFQHQTISLTPRVSGYNAWEYRAHRTGYLFRKYGVNFTERFVPSITAILIISVDINRSHDIYTVAMR